MINKESVYKARSLYYGLFSKLFAFTQQENRYDGIIEVLATMIENPIDENSGEALKEIQDFLNTNGYTALEEEYERIFHSLSTKVIPTTASYYHEGFENGRKKIEVRNFLAKTRIRRNEEVFKENEDSVGFLMTFMHELIELGLQGEKTYATIEHCLFKEIINEFIDLFIVRLYEHPHANIFQSVAIVLNAFMEFERLYFDVNKVVMMEDKGKRIQEGVSEAEAKRRAANKAKKEADKAQKALGA